MQLLRLFLKNLRTLYAKDYKKYSLMLAGVSLVTIIIGIIIDKFLPYNLLLNAIRAALALVIGFSFYSLMYIVTLHQSTLKTNDPNYIPIRKQFSRNQRLNLSILSFSLIIAFILILNKPGPLYTLFSGLGISGIIGTLAFARTYRHEYIKSIYGVQDARDLDSLNKRKKDK